VSRNRLFLLAGAIGAAAVVVVVVIVAVGTGSGSSSTTTTGTSGSASGAPTAVSTFAGVPQQGDTLGKPSAALTLTVFEDPQCPYCRQWNIDTLPAVVQNYVRTGRVKIAYRGIVIIGNNSLAGLAAVYAAGRQNKLWNMVEALYERQGAENSGWITIAVVKDAAKAIHANVPKLLKDMRSQAVANEIGKSERQASQYGINGTPTFAVQKPLGSFQQLQISGLEPSQFTPALDRALQ
jgi:protein-disulfide isomerase